MPTRRRRRTPRLERNIAINKMIGDLFQGVDYDLYKSLFVRECEEDPQEARDIRRALRSIVERHLPLIEEAGPPPPPPSTATVGTSATVAEATCGNQGGGVGCGGYYGDGGNTY